MGISVIYERSRRIEEGSEKGTRTVREERGSEDK
jgi:hypothetical protein